MILNGSTNVPNVIQMALELQFFSKALQEIAQRKEALPLNSSLRYV